MTWLNLQLLYKFANIMLIICQNIRVVGTKDIHLKFGSFLLRSVLSDMIDRASGKIQSVQVPDDIALFRPTLR